MISKKLLITGIATLALVGGCSKSGPKGSDFVLNAELPHGVWNLVIPEASAFSLRAISNTPNAGKVVITTTEIIEYYDYDTGADCSKQYTHKVTTPWNSTTQEPADGGSVSFSGGDQMAATITEAGGEQYTLNLQYEAEFTATTETTLDDQWCVLGVDPEPEPEPEPTPVPTATVEGIWLQLTGIDPERSRFQISVGAGDTFNGRFWYENIGHDGVPCSSWRDYTYTNGRMTVPEEEESFPLGFTLTGPNSMKLSDGTTFKRLGQRLPPIAEDCWFKDERDRLERERLEREG